MGQDDYNGAMLEMYSKLGKWYFALVISVPLACANGALSPTRWRYQSQV